jgi:hypothetical protein
MPHSRAKKKLSDACEPGKRDLCRPPAWRGALSEALNLPSQFGGPHIGHVNIREGRGQLLPVRREGYRPAQDFGDGAPKMAYEASASRSTSSTIPAVTKSPSAGR